MDVNGVTFIDFTFERVDDTLNAPPEIWFMA